ncbi:MAG: radical SAM protein, partial [Deltaproteobacteria bacterium]|nr:radical SAM protein [Deltaproteobacteria bacterium]
MACSYCFYYEKAFLFPQIKKHRMSEDTLECLIRQAMQQSDRQMTFSWQGGEPTLMGLDFYRKATQLQQNYGRGHVIGNGFQTNGILIDNAWAQFLNRYQFLVGLSLDGPRHIHDYYRKMRDGKGSWSKVTDTARLLLDSDVSTNALVVINDYSVNYPDEIYEFHKDLGLTHIQFIPCVETDDHSPGISAPFSVSS